MDGLTSEEMATVSQIFQEANSFVNDSATNDERENIIKFFLELTMQAIPPMLVSKTGLADMQKAVFGNPNIRDYVMKLSNVFFARWAASDNHVKALAANLARGLTQAPSANQKDSLIPEQVRERLPERKEIEPVLAANPWLMVILMVPLFISKKAYAPTSTPRARPQQQ